MLSFDWRMLKDRKCSTMTDTGWDGRWWIGNGSAVDACAIWPFGSIIVFIVSQWQRSASNLESTGQRTKSEPYYYYSFEVGLGGAEWAAWIIFEEPPRSTGRHNNMLKANTKNTYVIINIYIRSINCCPEYVYLEKPVASARTSASTHERPQLTNYSPTTFKNGWMHTKQYIRFSMLAIPFRRTIGW